MNTAEEVRAIRASTGLSQQSFGDRYGIPRRTVDNWEQGRRVPPEYVVRLLRIAVGIDRLD